MIKDLISILLISGLAFIARWYISFNLPLINLYHEPIFFSDLVNKPLSIASNINLILIFGNIFLTWFLGKLIFNRQVGLVAAFLYAFSPWTSYVDVSGSIYTFLLFWVLVLIVGLIRKNLLLILIPSVILIYTSITGIPILVALLVYLIVSKVINRKKIAFFIIALLFLGIPLYLAIFNNTVGFNNILKNQLSVFSNVGIFNAVNVFRGESLNTNLLFLSRIVENKYLYFCQYLIFDTLNHLVPVTYFSSQHRLLEFSQSPPIMLGFVLPFLLGLYKLFKDRRGILLIYFFPFLIISSIFSRISPDFEKLMLITPIIFLTTGVGVIQMFNLKKLIMQFLFILIVILICIQYIVVILDISLRENTRLLQFLNVI